MHHIKGLGENSITNQDGEWATGEQARWRLVRNREAMGKDC